MRASFVMSGVSDGLRRNLLMTIALVLTTSGRASALVNALRKLKIPEVKAAPIAQAWKRAQPKG